MTTEYFILKEYRKKTLYVCKYISLRYKDILYIYYNDTVTMKKHLVTKLLPINF